MIPLLVGQINSWAETQDPNHPMRTASHVVANPHIGAHQIKPVLSEGAKLFAYVDAVCIPAKDDLPPGFFSDLHEAMQYWREDWYWSEPNGPVLWQKDTAWPLARLLPLNRIADAYVDFLSTSAVIRDHDGIYFDQTTKWIEPWVFYQSGLDLTTPEVAMLQGDHAHYICRLLSGLRTKMDPSFLIIANTAGFTHPALDAICVEVESPSRPLAMKRAEAINACKNQQRRGMDRTACALIYADTGAGDKIVKGIWQ